MKIVQINAVCGKGSTGRIALDIAKEAERQGHECYIAYGHGSTDYHRGYRIGNKYDHLLHNILFSRILGLQGHGSKNSTLRFIKWMDGIKPDVIHIHNLHANFVNNRLLFDYIAEKQIPVLYTLHDCLNFTGKCTNFTSAKCDKYKTECHRCPLFKSSGIPSLFFDRSRKIFNDKKRQYARLGLVHSVAVSKWLRDVASHSILAKNGHTVGCIYNWIDYSRFKPANSRQIQDFKTKFGLDSDTRYLISVSQDWISGSIRFEDAVSLAAKLPAGYRLILVGRLGKNTQLPKQIIHIPYISSQEELSVAYSMAEAYVHFSIQDTFGLVIGEAMACGTIPITYNSTACAETPSTFGIIVEPRDIDAIVASIPLIEEKKKQAENMIKYVKENYDKDTNISLYIQAYNELFNSKNKGKS